MNSNSARTLRQLIAGAWLLMAAFGCVAKVDDLFALAVNDAPERASDISTPVKNASGLDASPADLEVPQTPSLFRFRDVIGEAGVDFVQFSSMTVEKHLPTANGLGAAIFDCNSDGRIDPYFANSTLLPLNKTQTGSNRL